MKSKFLREVYEFMLSGGYAKRTIETYLTWITDFIRHHIYARPQEMGSQLVESIVR